MINQLTAAGTRPTVDRLASHGWLVWLIMAVLATPVAAEQQYWTYSVRPGDNIWNLTKTYCTSVRHWQRIQQLNNVELDREIPPGTKLRFPLEILKHQPATARVTRLHGSGSIIRAASGATEPLEINTALRSGDRLVTTADSNVTLHFADGSQLLVLGNSEVVMDSLSAWGTTGMVDTRVRLQGGRVDTQVQPSQGPGSRYQIITPAAVAAVRGTEFRVAADAAEDVMRSEVTGGTVAVGSAAGSRDVPSGFGLVSETGQPPQTPRELLPPPQLASNPPVLRTLPLQFAWPALDGAERYRFQIAPSQAFETLLADQVTDTTAAEWNALPDGEYAIRVRGIDTVGLEGLDAVYAFKVDARPFAPVLSGPDDGALIREATPQLAWNHQEGINRYRLQLAGDDTFGETLLDVTVEQPGFTPAQALSPGTYHWRVAAIDSHGDQGVFSAAQAFTYRAPLAAVQTGNANVEGNRLVIDWTPVPDAARYRVQLAEDPAFRRVVLEHELTEPRLETRRPLSQRYYYRARAETGSAETGPWSATREVDVPPYHYWPLLLLAAPLLLLL